MTKALRPDARRAASTSTSAFTRADSEGARPPRVSIGTSCRGARAASGPGRRETVDRTAAAQAEYDAAMDESALRAGPDEDKLQLWFFKKAMDKAINYARVAVSGVALVSTFSLEQLINYNSSVVPILAGLAFVLLEYTPSAGWPIDGISRGMAVCWCGCATRRGTTTATCGGPVLVFALAVCAYNAMAWSVSQSTCRCRRRCARGDQGVHRSGGPHAVLPTSASSTCWRGEVTVRTVAFRLPLVRLDRGVEGRHAGRRGVVVCQQVVGLVRAHGSCQW